MAPGARTAAARPEARGIDGRQPRRAPGPECSRPSSAGRVAVVTGAARGVGEALARSLSGAGMQVDLLGRERTTLRETAESLPVASMSSRVRSSRLRSPS
ncbi:SDR family NAD(P)-dependent oxidoreductase [Streptomyces anulatus]|uniref:SDR family NAD(P)-dependent oxidoreductase n=1 Tax=Streptomyces anulatus TaxID=1892 RepID=UPI00356B6898